MDSKARASYLRAALLAVGLVFLLAVYPLTVVWPAGWAWHHGRSEYLEMIIALYATLGLFLVLASRSPEQHVSLIAFTIWSSVVHGSVMAVQAFVDPMHRGHLIGDVPALFVVALVLGWLCPQAFRWPFARRAG